MTRGRGDRPAILGLRVATGGGDLIEDIHRQQRRRLLKRAAQIIALAVVLLLIGVALKIVKDRRERAQALEAAYQHFVRGIPAEMELSARVLEQSIADVAADDPQSLAALALVRGHLWVEFDEGEAEAREAAAAVPERARAHSLVQAMVALGEDDLSSAQAALDTEPAVDGEAEPGPFEQAERAWLQGVIVMAASPDDADAIAVATAALSERLDEQPEQVSARRQLALAYLVGGQTDDALKQLALAREHAPSHMGLSADDALYNAYLRQRLSGVASVADQLLEQRPPGMSARDVAHAQLARGVVHVHSGEHDQGLTMFDAAWEKLAPWDRLSQRLVIQSALEAGDAERIEQWVDEVALPGSEADIYRAWSVLQEGDVMEALRRLADLPQADRWVGYLQALALVEQGRYAEAQPWIERTEKLLPGRLEIEVARARVELRLGDRAVALRKLEALAREEAHAPRAWTGLGEAYLLQDEPDAAEAAKALARAIEREAYPAEAMRLRAQTWDDERRTKSEAIPNARKLFERAAKTNPHLPRYQEALALYLADIGFADEAREAMEEVVDSAAVGPELLLRLAALRAEADPGADIDDLVAQAEERGASPDAIALTKARIDIESGERSGAEKAQAALEPLVARLPQNIEARVLLSEAYLKQFDRKAAETLLRRGLAGLEDDTKDGRLLFALARIESRSAKTRLAAPRARRAWLHLLEEDRPPYELFDVADLATRLWIKLKRERAAVTIAEQLTDRLGYHTMAWTIRARTELNAGEAAAARKSAERAIELDGDNARAHEIHGHALLRYGMHDQARAAYERALELVKGTDREASYRAHLKKL